MPANMPFIIYQGINKSATKHPEPFAGFIDDFAPFDAQFWQI